MDLSSDYSFEQMVAEVDEVKSSSEDVMREELKFLWNDLNDATRSALNGRWSTRCDTLVWRIVRLSRVSGIWIQWEEIQYDLLTSGIWQGITKAAGIDTPMPTEDDLKRNER